MKLFSQVGVTFLRKDNSFLKKDKAFVGGIESGLSRIQGDK